MLVRSGSWDATTDIAVTGYGCAGAVAAVTAVENGASVLVLEKQPKETHQTNTSMSGGVYITPSDARTALDYMTAICQVFGMPRLSFIDAKPWRSMPGPVHPH